MRAQLYKTQLKKIIFCPRTVLIPGRVGWVHVKIREHLGAFFPTLFGIIGRAGGQPIKYAALWPVCVIEVMLVVLAESTQFMVALRQQSVPWIFHM